MGTRENKVETHFKDQIKALGGISRKWVSPGVDGVPDQIVIIKTLIIGVEVKCKDGILSVMQCREHDRLNNAGMMTTTVYGHEGVDNLILNLKRFNHGFNSNSNTEVIYIQREYR